MRHLPSILLIAAMVSLPYQSAKGSSDMVAAVQLSPSGTPDIEGDSKAQLEEALRSLKSTKRVARGEAERILASIGAFQAAREKRRPPQPLDSVLDTCIAAPSSACLLEEAFAQAYRVPDESRRDWALSAVAAAYHEGGDSESVYSVLALMDDPRTALRLLEKTVGLEGDTVRNTAAIANDPSADAESESVDWAASVNKGDWAGAQRAIDSISESRYRTVAWARLSRMAIDAGETALAAQALQASEELIDDIGLSYARSFAHYEASLAHIALVSHSNGGEVETRAAAAAASKIEQPHLRADAYWRLAQVGSKTLAPSIHERAETSFTQIASRLRQVFVLTFDEVKNPQRQERAMAIAATISDPLDRARAFTRLARYVR